MYLTVSQAILGPKNLKKIHVNYLLYNLTYEKQKGRETERKKGVTKLNIIPSGVLGLSYFCRWREH